MAILERQKDTDGAFAFIKVDTEVSPRLWTVMTPQELIYLIPKGDGVPRVRYLV